MVRETLFNKGMSGWSANEEGPVPVNPVTDPSAPVTDPINPNFTPQSNTEFGIAVNQLVKNLPDNQMPALYGAVKDAIEQKEDKEEKDEMDKKAAAGGTGHVEEAIRTAVRRVFREAAPNKKFGPVVGDLPPVKKIPAGVHGGEYTRWQDKQRADLKKWLPKAADAVDAPVVDDEPVDDVPADAEEPTSSSGSSTKAYKATAIGGMSDVNYDEEKGEHKPASFQEIAKELGFSVAGAKQAVDKALEKATFLSQDMDEDDLEILVLVAMNDYIKMLSKGVGVEDGEEPLTPSDIQLMKDHPDIVRELDGFREFLHNAIRRARKEQAVDYMGDEGAPAAKEEPGAATAPEATASADAAATAEPVPTLKAGKASYKVYKGGARYGNKPVVTRVKGRVYGPSGETKFSPNDQAVASVDGDKLKVKKPDSDHTQSWDPVDESDDLDEAEIAMKPVGKNGKPVEAPGDVHHAKSLGKGGDIDLDFGNVPHAGHNKPKSTLHGDDIDIDWNGMDESRRPVLRLSQNKGK